MIRFVVLSIGLLLAGCSSELRDIGREPHLTPVGAGLTPERVAIPSEPLVPPAYATGNSFWQDSGVDLFRDPRATKIGDVVTVKIQIKDKASLDNNTNRSRNGTSDLKLGATYDFNTILKGKGDASLDANVDSKTTTDSKGAIQRSESIDLLVAAVVTDVLPNGNLVISGTQEVRVNFEVRVLGVAGIVRPRDISTDNSVSYDRIAEARISYGGRGRITEVQQPGVGQQIVDLLRPY
jgi:flagellar L-ring protein precursor FlgH